MVIVRIKGGLGNQLFQYAAGFSIAHRLNTGLTLDTTFYSQQALRGYKLDKLSIDSVDTIIPSKSINIIKNKYLNKILRSANVRKINVGKGMSYILETHSDIMEPFFVEEADGIYLDGYYQSEEYFKEHRESLLRQFVPNYVPKEEYLKIITQIQSTFSIGVHVRRGDFLKGANDTNPNHYLLNKQYYHDALDYMTKRFAGNAIYYWFSDDMEWVRQNFGNQGNYRFISLHTEQADIDEMMLMKNCRHIISANSTFSWWAAWLNEHDNAIRIVPARRFGNLHMIPDGWVKI